MERELRKSVDECYCVDKKGTTHICKVTYFDNSYMRISFKKCPLKEEMKNAYL